MKPRARDAKLDFSRRHTPGKLESAKFEHLRGGFEHFLEELQTMPFDEGDFLKYFPMFTGHLTLARFLSLHRRFIETSGLAGHIADVGVFQGSSLLFWAKLCKIYEPTTITQVHGFDWFRGNVPGEKDGGLIKRGGGRGSKELLERLVRLQDLDPIVRVHDIDLTNGLPSFAAQNTHLMFRLVFLDCGMYEVLSAAIPFFWERLVPGGIMVFDQYNFDAAPGETLAVNEFFISLGVQIQADPHGWMPTAFVVKS